MSITWDNVEFDGPYQLDSWDPPAHAGVYAIMHKPNPNPQPNTFHIDYFGETEDFSGRGFPWNHERSNCFVKQAGTKSNVFVGFCILLGSTQASRRTIEQNLIRRYNPECNREI